METQNCQIPNLKQTQNNFKKPIYDLEQRTLCFAYDVRVFIKKCSRSLFLLEDGKQLIRSSGSVGANYIEANESLGKKDFLMRLKISRKEAKESRYWLQLLKINMDSQELESERNKLINESTQLISIFSSIISKNI
ncbi:MAG: four helix bundle protein [Elusimicrobiota bacterium]